MIDQNRHPNFRVDGQLYLVRCFSCDPVMGRENYIPATATGRCAWCGWEESGHERLKSEAMADTETHKVIKTIPLGNIMVTVYERADGSCKVEAEGVKGFSTGKNESEALGHFIFILSEHMQVGSLKIQ